MMTPAKMMAVMLVAKRRLEPANMVQDRLARAMPATQSGGRREMEMATPVAEVMAGEARARAPMAAEARAMMRSRRVGWVRARTWVVSWSVGTMRARM